MVRLLILALVAIGIFTQMSGLASEWLKSNGYMESNAEAAKLEKPARTKRNDTRANMAVRSGRTVLKANKQGHFVTRAYINNKPIRVLVDTGATIIALSYEDAKRLGLRPKKSDFTDPVSTANGRTYFAPAKLRTVRVGQAEERNVPASIAPKGMLNVTLLGMSYLKELKRFEIRDGKLILEN